MMRFVLILLMYLILVSCGYAQNSASFQPKVEKSIWSNPQKQKPCIIKDAVDKENNRFIFGNYRLMSTDFEGADYFVFHGSLSAAFSNDSVLYDFCISIKKNTRLRVEKDSPCLIKLGDDSILELSCNCDVDDIGTIQRYATMSGTYTEYNIYPRYRITEDELSFFSKGIKKMRIEVSGNICDIILKKDNVSTFILDEYTLIKDALKTKKSFYDGF